MWGLKACRLFFSVSSACTSLKRKHRDAILKDWNPGGQAALWTRGSAGKAMCPVPSCLMSSQIPGANCPLWWEGWWQCLQPPALPWVSMIWKVGHSGCWLVPEVSQSPRDIPVWQQKGLKAPLVSEDKQNCEGQGCIQSQNIRSWKGSTRIIGSDLKWMAHTCLGKCEDFSVCQMEEPHFLKSDGVCGVKILVWGGRTAGEQRIDPSQLHLKTVMQPEDSGGLANTVLKLL